MEKEYARKIKELESMLNDIKIKEEICDWVTQDNRRCRKGSVASVGDHKFCKIHKRNIKEFCINENTEEFCDFYKNLKIIPRSHKQIKHIMKENDNEETIVDVQFPGGCVEQADITESGFILLLSDNSKYFYKPQRGDLKAKDLKVLIRKYCKNSGTIEMNEEKYCEDCYKKNKNNPKLYLI